MKQGKLIFPLLGIFIITSCQKDTPDDPDGFLDDRGYVTLRLNHSLGADDFAYGHQMVDDFGTEYHFTRVSMYLSNPVLGTSNEEGFALVTPAVSDYEFTRIEGGTYDGLSFNIGLDPATNHANPANYDNDHPLALQSPSTHWNWNSGYLFIVLEGLFDDDGDDVPDKGFVMHIGKDEMLREKAFSTSLAVKSRAESVVDINLDWAELFSGVDLINQNLTHTTNPGLDTLVANNAINAFTLP